MRSKIKVNPNTGVLYMPKNLLIDGFKGEMDMFVGALTLTLVHPEADLSKVKDSLEIIIREIDLRLMGFT